MGLGLEGEGEGEGEARRLLGGEDPGVSKWWWWWLGGLGDLLLACLMREGNRVDRPQEGAFPAAGIAEEEDGHDGTLIHSIA